jgi:RHS repeat-associated protein
MTWHPRHVGVHAMSKSFSARGSSMAAVFRLFSSTLRRHLACRHRLDRFVTMMALMSTLTLAAGATRADAQEVIEYYGTDALGSIRVVFAPDGTVKARSDYLPFGEEWQPTTPGGQLPSQRFTGQQRDAEEGHDNFNARSYHPRLGRFTTVDPASGNIYSPQSWNRYAYVSNRPANFTDPTGMVEHDLFSDYTQLEGAWCSGNCFVPPVPPSFSYGGGRAPEKPQAPGGSNDDDSGDGEEEEGQILIPNAGTIDPGSELANVVTPIVIPSPAAIAVTAPKVASIIYRALFGGAKTVEPQFVRFSQDSIAKVFNDGRGVRGMIDDLLTGKLNPMDVAPIRLVERDGLLYTLDNRRLFAFQEAGIAVPYRWAREQEIIQEIWKFTTTNDGISIVVR